MTVHNFSAGPGAVPSSVLAEAQDGIARAPGSDLSVLGISHRDPGSEQCWARRKTTCGCRGGLLASLYNAVSLDSVTALCQFLDDFQTRAGA